MEKRGGVLLKRPEELTPGDVFDLPESEEEFHSDAIRPRPYHIRVEEIIENRGGLVKLRGECLWDDRVREFVIMPWVSIRLIENS